MLITLFAASLANANSDGPQLRFNSLTYESGLSNGFVHGIVQDDSGFIWIGTENGLNRFDGYETRVFLAEPGDPGSLSSNDVSDLYVDRDGVLWIATWTGGLNKFDDSLEVFHQYRADPDDPTSIPTDSIRSLTSANDGSLVVGTWGAGILRMDSNSGSFARIGAAVDREISVESLKIADILVDDNDRIWAAAWDKGVVQIDSSSRSVRQWLVDTNGQTETRFGRISALHLSGSTLWVGSDTGGVICIDTRTLEQSCEIPFAGNYREQIRAIHLDSSGHLWVGTLGGGLTRITLVDGSRAKYSFTPGRPSSISSNDIFTLFEDRSGVLWLGTLGSGVDFFAIDGQPFAHFQSDPFADSTLQSNAIRALAEGSDGLVWIGTDGGGLHSFDPENGIIRPYDVPASRYSERIWSLHADSAGRIWVGTWGGGAYLLDTSSDSIIRSVSLRDGLIDNVVFDVLPDSNGRLWVIADGPGITMFEPDGAGFTHHIHDSADASSISSNDITAVYEDKDGAVWLGSGDGHINRYTTSGDFERYLPTEEPDQENSAVYAFADGPDGLLWIGTAGGPARLDRHSGEFVAFAVDEDELTEPVTGMIVDHDSNVWLSTNNGLYRYTGSPARFERFKRHNGLQGSKFNRGATLLASDGALYFGGLNGFNRVDPATVIRNSTPPLATVTAIRLFHQPAEIGGGSYLPVAPHQLKKLQLPYDQNLISFEYSALHYVAPEENRYTYRLVGFDDSWQHASASNRIAHYTNLKPGDYKFRLRASSSDDIWTSEFTELELTILPPWWATVWAYAAYAGIGILLLFTIVQWRTKRLQVQTDRLRDAVREQTSKIRTQNRTIDAQAAGLRDALASKNELFAKISHEFRTPLTLIFGPLELLRKRKADQADRQQFDMIERNAQRLLRLVEQLMGLARSDSPAERQSIALDVSTTVSAIAANFESAALDRKIAIETDIAPGLLIVCDPDGFEQAVLNILSNALKYSDDAGAIRVEARQKADQVVISIVDNGIGISPAELDLVFEPFHRADEVVGGTAQGSGLGLAVTRERVEADNGSIKITSELGTGTTVKLSYPSADPVESPLSRSGSQSMALELASLSDTDINPQSDALHSDSKPLLLVADDNPQMLEHLLTVLAPHYECITAANGAEAVELARERVPDLIVSDVNMPRMDGFELTRLLKGDDRSCHIPIILLTARTDPESRRRGFEKHADIFMTKPFNPDELLQRIENLMGLLAVRRQGVTSRLFGSAEDLLAAAPEDCSARDQQFIEKLAGYLGENYKDPESTPAGMAESVAMSERQLQRKLKSLLNHTPAELLRLYRLEQARSQLLEGERPASVAFDVGFSSQAHFGACFKARYGDSPGSYADAKRQR